MSKQVKLRRGTTAEMGAFTGAQGELCYDEEHERAVLHNGTKQGGAYLAVMLLPVTRTIPSGTLSAGATSSGDFTYAGVTQAHAVVHTIQSSLADGVLLQVSHLSKDVLRWQLTNTSQTPVTYQATNVVLIAIA
ncbi:tail protein [Vibrio phage K436]